MQPDFTQPPIERVERELDRVLPAFGTQRIGRATAVSGGTLNGNYRVETPDGPVFARRWRGGMTVDRVNEEHGLLRWVAERGVPIVQPRLTKSGASVFDLDGVLWSVFPWVEGRTTVRGSIDVADAGALGEMHGRVHAVLAEHPISQGAPWSVPPQSIPWNTAESLADFALIHERAVAMDEPEDLIAAIDFHVGLLEEALADEEFQARIVETSRARPRSEGTGMPAQLTHGDFHDQQMLFGPGGEIVAVNDWEMYRVMPRVWEVIRSVSFSELYEEPGLGAYLSGYREHVRLPEEECRLGVEAWWIGRLHARWVYWTYFMENNERVAEFFPKTDAELRRLADEGWRAELADRFVRAARG